MLLRQLISILSLCMAFPALADAQTRMFYRIAAGTNSAIVSWSRPNVLAWTNAAAMDRFNLEWAFDLSDFANGGMDAVAYGSVTDIAMAVAAPIPTTERPSRDILRIIPAGLFLMGNSDTNVNKPVESPVHEVAVGALYMDKYEVRKSLWDTVKSWAATNGYADLGAGAGTDGTHPVQIVTWYDCVKWCNARSEMDGLTPVYHTDSAKTNVYRAGTTVLDASFVLWSANGYRLPTEAEWEKAARGGLVTNHYPWPSTSAAFTNDIDGSNANYKNSGDPFETAPTTDTDTTPVGYYNGGMAGPDMTNGYGLYDMAGNVSEWCWDWYGTNYYATYPTNAWPADPTGPTGGTQRVTRGCNWNNPVAALRCAARAGANPATGSGGYLGFRCVRGL